MGPYTPQYPPTRPGFSIPELMVVIGLIGALMSIALPAVAGARRRAQVVMIQNEMRQGAAGIIAHAGDRRDRFPFDPSASPVFQLSYYWRSFIESEGTLRGGRYRRSDDFGPDHRLIYSPTCMSSPVYWGDGPLPIPDPGNPPRPTWRTIDMIGPVRVADVNFPSQKAILTFEAIGSAPGPSRFLLDAPAHPELTSNPLSMYAAADGSARQIEVERLIRTSRWNEALNYPGSSSSDPVASRFGATSVGLHTFNGVWGLDWR